MERLRAAIYGERRMTTSVKDKVPNSVSTWLFDPGRYCEKSSESNAEQPRAVGRMGSNF